jgi:hypothetical protein
MAAQVTRPPQAMILEQSKLFMLLDGYAKRHHKCFVAEFWFDEDKDEYTVCFRPLFLSPESPNRYACRYVTMEIGEAKESIRAGMLTASIANVLDEELRPLGLTE